MELKKFYKKYKIIINGVIMWVIPWLILFLSYPKSLYSDRAFLAEVLNVDLVFMIFSLILVLLVSVFLYNLKKNKSKRYKVFLWASIIVYFLILFALLFFINLLLGIKDL